MSKIAKLMLVGIGLFAAGCNPPSTSDAQKAIADSKKSVAETQQAMVEAENKATAAFKEGAGKAIEAAKDGAAGVAEEVKEKASAAVDQANAALEGVEGGADLFKQVTELFTSAKESVDKISDTASADAAAVKLGELGTSVDGIKAAYDKLPDAAKATIKGIIEKGVEELKTVIAKAIAIPGVEAIVKPKIDELLGKLTSVLG